MVSLSPVVVKIGDFGISKQVSPEDHTELLSMVGTTAYMAPEVLGFLSSDTSVYTSAVDIWSLGCIIHAVITRETPLSNMRGLLDYIQNRVPFPEAKLIAKGASPAAITFLNRLMMPFPGDRLTAEQALDDPWLIVEEEKNIREQEGGDTIWIRDDDSEQDLAVPTGMNSPF